MTERDDHRTGSGGGQGQRPGRAGRGFWVPQGGHPRGRGAGWLRGGQGHCPGRACRVARSSLAGNSGRTKGVSKGYVFWMGVHHLQGLRVPFEEFA
jgi:hypothetical protein